MLATPLPAPAGSLPSRARPPRTLTDWAAALADRGIVLSASSSAVPVELVALLPDGRGLMFTCRGTAVTLAVYDAVDVRLAVPVLGGAPPELAVPVEHREVAGDGARAALEAGARLVLGPGGPRMKVRIDGAARFGWRAYEAGLLRVAQAAPLLTELLDRVELAAGTTARAA